MTGACCQRLPRTGGASPFARLIVLDYHDGPVSGFVRCEVCLTAYWFEMLDWDDGQDVRVFSLSPLRDGAFDRALTIERALPRDLRARSEGDQRHALEAFGVLRALAGAPVLVVAAMDLRRHLLAVVPAAEEPAASGDWFSHLGLPRSSATEP